MTPAKRQEIFGTDENSPPGNKNPSPPPEEDDDISSTFGSAFSTPTEVHNAFGASTSEHPATIMATPTAHVNYDPSAASPMTPYYPSQGSKLVQQTCPPKQIQQGLFSKSGEIDEQKDEKFKMRLEQVRRRTMNWKPKISSPLGRSFMK